MHAPDPYLLRLDPVLVPKPWGGRTLEALGKRLPDGGTYGESWDLADLPEEAVTTDGGSRSLVVDGPLAGASLRDVIASWGSALLGSANATGAGNFPLLYKFLDAQQHLSVQVHPDETYAREHPGVSVKTESWYIVDAEPGSVIYKDVRPGVTVDDVASAAGGPELVKLLQAVEAQPGSFHHLPAGLIHALGAGVLVAEPQTPSDTTFRLYDWSAEYGRAGRATHLDEAVKALRIAPAGAFALPPVEKPHSRRLIATDSYWIVEHALTSGSEGLGEDHELRIISLLDGQAELARGNDIVALDAGDTVVVPAGLVPEVGVATTMATWLEIGLAGTPRI